MTETVTIESLVNFINENKFMKKYVDDINNNILDKLVNYLAKDLCHIYYNIINDFNVDIKYNSKIKELSISVCFIQSDNILNEELFDIAIKYYDKYEEYLIANDIYDIVIDFNVIAKNENLKVITVYDSGK